MTLDEIKAKLNLEQAIALQEEGFRLYSEGKVTVPPVGYMPLPGAEVHIKAGWIEGDPLFFVKIAGAYDCNVDKVQGVILAMDTTTGQPRVFLNDEAYLTNLRTAIAGLIAAKYLAPKEVRAIGIVGTGVQARLQAELLKRATPCRTLVVWGRDPQKVADFIQEMSDAGFQVQQAANTAELCRSCNLIVTTTSAREPLLWADDVQLGTHITAVGADAPGKQELDPALFHRVDRCVVDSKAQCTEHGEVVHPIQAGNLRKQQLIELGELLSQPHLQRQSDREITVADLTGVGVQDIQIAKSCLIS